MDKDYLSLLLSIEDTLMQAYEFAEDYEDGAPDASPKSKDANHLLTSIRVNLAKVRSRKNLLLADPDLVYGNKAV